MYIYIYICPSCLLRKCLSRDFSTSVNVIKVIIALPLLAGAFIIPAQYLRLRFVVFTITIDRDDAAAAAASVISLARLEEVFILVAE